MTFKPRTRPSFRISIPTNGSHLKLKKCAFRLWVSAYNGDSLKWWSKFFLSTSSALYCLSYFLTSILSNSTFFNVRSVINSFLLTNPLLHIRWMAVYLFWPSFLLNKRNTKCWEPKVLALERKRERERNKTTKKQFPKI